MCPSPPLLWSDLTCQNLIDCARAGIPAELVSMPLAGATAPVTLAAAVVQHTAECLSGIVIGQLAKPGAKIVWGGSPAAFDMREGTTPMGDVGTWMIDCAYAQVGKSLGLPTHAYLGMSDAKIIDVQCGLESAGGTLLGALAGVNMISGAGMMDFESCQSLEKLVIDAEIIGMAKRLLRGIEPRDEPIALGLFQKLGHRADYLAEPHTLKWFAKELYLPSPVIDRATTDGWLRKGATTAAERAVERVRSLVASYQPAPVAPELRRELRAIATRAAQVVRHGGAAAAAGLRSGVTRDDTPLRGATCRHDLLAQITNSLVDGDPDATVAGTQQAIAAGLEPLAIIEGGLVPGMRIVGDKYASGEYFLPNLIVSASGMKQAMALLEPELKARRQELKSAGTVVIGTVRGDIHEIGKSLVATMLAANGFEVHDLGVDVSVDAFVVPGPRGRSQPGRPVRAADDDDARAEGRDRRARRRPGCGRR